MSQKVEGIIRHIMTVIAGFLISLNLLPEDTVTDAQVVIGNLVGVIFAAIAFVRSYITKKT
jgi:hypothetical protein